MVHVVPALAGTNPLSGYDPGYTDVAAKNFIYSNAGLAVASSTGARVGSHLNFATLPPEFPVELSVFSVE